MSSLVRAPAWGKVDALGGPVAVDHDAVGLGEERLQVAGHVEVEIQADPQQLVDPLRVVRHLVEEALPVEQVGDIEDALGVRVVGHDLAASLLPVDAVELGGETHQLRGGDVDLRRGADRGAIEGGARPGHLALADLVPLPGDDRDEHDPEVGANGGNAVGGPVLDGPSPAHLGVPHRPGVVETRAIPFHVVLR